jgi:hypothetical protein
MTIYDQFLGMSRTQIYHTRGELAKHYTIDVVVVKFIYNWGIQVYLKKMCRQMSFIVKFCVKVNQFHVFQTLVHILLCLYNGSQLRM